MGRGRLSALAGGIALGLSAPAGAQQALADPVVTDRPTFAASAAAVAPGDFLLESGYTLTRDDGVNSHALGEVLLRIGVLPRTEIRFGLNSFAWTDDPAGGISGLADASLGLKIELARGGSGAQRFNIMLPDVALLVGTTIPTGGTAFGEDALQPSAVLAVSWNVAERVSIGANANAAAQSQNGDRYAQFSGAVSLGVSLADRVAVFGEYFMFAPTGPNEGSAGSLNGGLIFLASNDFQLDARAGFGLFGGDADLFVGAGVARRF